MQGESDRVLSVEEEQVDEQLALRDFESSVDSPNGHTAGPQLMMNTGPGYLLALCGVSVPVRLGLADVRGSGSLGGGVRETAGTGTCIHCSEVSVEERVIGRALAQCTLHLRPQVVADPLRPAVFTFVDELHRGRELEEVPQGDECGHGPQVHHGQESPGSACGHPRCR